MQAEILVKKGEVAEWIGRLPESGPFGKEVLANTVRSIIVSYNLNDRPAQKSEMHENDTDVFIAVEGAKDVWVGGEMPERFQKSPGEWGGGNLIGARAHHIEAGDILIIPKGVPHQHRDGQIKMIVLKIK